MLDDGSTVRLFQFSVDAAKIELPIDVALQLLGENPAVVYVYVDEHNVLRELQILSNGNDSPEVVVQRFVYLEDAPVVTLPDPSVVDDA